jgi:transcriptional regulator with XRE-family HTH domain
MSQLALATEAEISARHLSFLETGRAQPSREMVLLLASVLAVPLREQNVLLTAAGFAPVHRETALAAPELGQVRRALDLMLAQQEPFPALVVDRHWNLLMQNEGADRVLGLFLDPNAAAAIPSPPNVARLTFHPGGLRPYIANWEALAGPLLQQIHREARAVSSTRVRSVCSMSCWRIRGCPPVGGPPIRTRSPRRCCP